MSKRITEEMERKLARIADEVEERWERGEEPGGRLQRSRMRTFAIRVPEELAEQLRRIAARTGTAPTALARRWLEERADAEFRGDTEPDPRVQRAVRTELERAGLVRKPARERLSRRRARPLS